MAERESKRRKKKTATISYRVFHSNSRTRRHVSARQQRRRRLARGTRITVIIIQVRNYKPRARTRKSIYLNRENTTAFALLFRVRPSREQHAHTEGNRSQQKREYRPAVREKGNRICTVSAGSVRKTFRFSCSKRGFVNAISSNRPSGPACDKTITRVL